MQTQTIQIGDRLIGPGQPCFLVVEVGTTCLGDLDNALKLVEAGAAAGVDAMKFQVIDPEQLSDTKVEYQFSANGETHRANMKEMFSQLQFSREQWAEIRDACHAKGMVFFATVDYLEGVDLLEELAVPVHKMGAWDFTYMPLVKKIAETSKPLFVDLGPATEQEVDELVAHFLKFGGKTVLFMHDFHTQDAAQMNMRAVDYLNGKFSWPAGFSSPGRNDDLDFLALGLDAYYLEKRLILSRSLKAFHADESLEPAELKDWVARIRRAEKAMGRNAIVPSDADLRMSGDFYRSIVAATPIARGEVFTVANLACKRPGSGIATSHLEDIIGRRATRDLNADELLQPGDFS
jgi:N,N'-diacetyllegionaminate synthase